MQGFFLIFTMNITYPDLPISRRRNDILAAMREHQVIVVVGETGSGKTTQLPKMAMELAGEVVSGLFFEGLSGPQFATTRAVRLLAELIARLSQHKELGWSPDPRL